MGSKLVRGVYVPGCNHSPLRPLFYASLGLWQGTINIQLPKEICKTLILPNKRKEGVDPIDLNANQDFLIRRCRLKAVKGYQILPIDKTTNAPRGHHSSKIIEISLEEKIELKPREELEVELKGFEE
jgi:hypothetical protein